MVSDYRVSNGWMLSNKSFPLPYSLLGSFKLKLPANNIKLMIVTTLKVSYISYRYFLA